MQVRPFVAVPTTEVRLNQPFVPGVPRCEFSADSAAHSNFFLTSETELNPFILTLFFTIFLIENWSSLPRLMVHEAPCQTRLPNAATHTIDLFFLDFTVGSIH